jgi:hypothetical protein
LVKKKEQEKLVNSIKKTKTELYLISEKNKESKTIDKQIDLDSEGIAESK